MSSGRREGGEMMCEVCGETLFGTDFCQGCGAPVSNDADTTANDDSDDDTEFVLDDEMEEEMTEWP
jgi:hypothetical protein